jgi:hypothetical protein
VKRLALILMIVTLEAGPAWAGSGWYLIYPPFKTNVSDAAEERILQELYKGPTGSSEIITLLVDDKRPLNEWVKHKAYGSLQDCAEALRPVRRMPKWPEREALRRALLSRAICIAADDPRLACDQSSVTCVRP